jgi:hypothetical protein
MRLSVVFIFILRRESIMKKLVLFTLALSCLSTYAFAKDVKVKSWCPMTHAVGFGKAPTFDAAKDAAIKACLSNGGMQGCCPKFYRQV